MCHTVKCVDFHCHQILQISKFLHWKSKFQYTVSERYQPNKCTKTAASLRLILKNSRSRRQLQNIKNPVAQSTPISGTVDCLQGDFYFTGYFCRNQRRASVKWQKIPIQPERENRTKPLPGTRNWLYWEILNTENWTISLSLLGDSF